MSSEKIFQTRSDNRPARLAEAYAKRVVLPALAGSSLCGGVIAPQGSVKIPPSLANIDMKKQRNVEYVIWKIKTFAMFLFFTFYFSLFTFVYADISINASVDRDRVAFGESVSLQVNVSGDVSNLPPPALPALADFNVYSSGTSQNISFANGKVSSSRTYNFVLSPNKPGKFTIGPVSLTVDGKTYSTEPINIEVLSTGTSSVGSAPPQEQSGKQQVNAAPGENREIFITASLDKKNVFVNESVTYTFRFFTARNLYSNPGYNPPDFTGFIVEDLPPQRSYRTQINGKTYSVVEIKTKLFPASPGMYNLGTASLKVNIQDFSRTPFGNFFDDDFFKSFFSSGKTTVVKSEPLTLKVVALPAEGKPADFAGAVGIYRISAVSDKSKVEANSPVTLTVNISGEGNIKSISEPKFPGMVGVRKYDTVSSVNISKANYSVTGSKIFKTVVIPERPGIITIPEISFSYFDPGAKKYKNIKSSPLRLEILPSSRPVSANLPPVGSGGIDILGQDIRFIKTELGKKPNGNIKNTASNILLIITPIFFLISLGYNRYDFFVSGNSGIIKSRRAYKEFNKKISGLEKSFAGIEDFYGAIFDLTIKYLSDKSRVVLSGCTFGEIENVLLQKNISPENIKTVRDILENADFVRFTPVADKNINMKMEADRIRTAIRNIEKDWKL